MALTGKELAIETPCPIDLDRARSDGRSRAWDCAHCSKTVHVLSSMTEREARDFLREHEGQTLCITYLEGADGEIRFQPERNVVPIGRLTRPARRRPAAAAAAAAVGFAAALAACTPVDNDAVQQPTPVQTEAVEAKADAVADAHRRPSMADLVAQAREKAADQEAEPEAKPEPIPDPEPIRDPEAIPRPGGITVPHVAPPEPPPPPPTPITAPTHKRGGAVIRRP